MHDANPGPQPGGLPAGLWLAMARSTSVGYLMPFHELHHHPGTPNAAQTLETAHRASAAGIDVLWFADHVVQRSPDDHGYDGSIDAWTLIAGVAAAMPSMHIGVFVAGPALRQPSVIAGASDTISRITGGRFVLGLRADRRLSGEIRRKGIGEPDEPDFADAVRQIRTLVRRNGDGPSILIDSDIDEHASLIVGYADARITSWNDDVAGRRSLSGTIDATCVAAGRDPASLVRVVTVHLALDEAAGQPSAFRSGRIEEHIHQFEMLRWAGYRHIMCTVRLDSGDAIDRLGEIVAGFDALTGEAAS